VRDLQTRRQYLFSFWSEIGPTAGPELWFNSAKNGMRRNGIHRAIRRVRKVALYNYAKEKNQMTGPTKDEIRSAMDTLNAVDGDVADMAIMMTTTEEIAHEMGFDNVFHDDGSYTISRDYYTMSFLDVGDLREELRSIALADGHPLPTELG
jgi:hypothetical protein